MSKEQDMTIRELVEKYGEAAALWGCTLGLLHAKETDRLKKDFLAAIARLERKAATAKAESDAWRAAMDGRVVQYTMNTIDGEDELAAYRSAVHRLVDARTATDEAWKPENKEAKQ